MTCPSCQRDNPPEARFCSQCGKRLAVACSHCGAELPPEANFCSECGQPVGAAPERSEPRVPSAYTPKHLADKILTAKSALEGERKQVTVLFADVMGSVELAETVDPEEWHRIMDRFFAILSEGVHRFEGTINQFTGDGIMALFGAPIAHEDHAQRACYAALRLREDLRRYAEELLGSQGVNFSVRMGLNSGEVVVGRIGDDLRMDYTAQGHTVGLASRLEQLASPGSVYLSADTAALVSGFFRLRDLGEFELKGAREPLRVYELEDVGPERSRFDIARARGFSRFVGREKEMEKLEHALASAMEGQGQIVAVMGEAGIGKSRLCIEFAERCRAQGIAVHGARCVPYGRAVPLSPVIEFLQGYFGVDADDDPEVARKKITAALVCEDERVRDSLPLLFDFLGVPDPEHPVSDMDAESRHRLFVQTLKVCTTSHEAPTVVLFENLQWIDGGTEVFLEQLADTLPGNPALLLVNYRPDYDPHWLRGRTHDQLRLLPLGDEAVAELLTNVLGTDPGVRALADRIRERAGGNPFFVEEVAQALAEAGTLGGERGAYRLEKCVDELAIPPTVHGVVAERIDGLNEQQKELLQTAAVIGRRFSQPLLQQVIDLPEAEFAHALRALESSEFIYSVRLYPTAEYAFRQGLTQEVAYRAQLSDRRARIHASVARALEAEKCEKLDECAALLAHHWEQAGEALRAARWSLAAGERTAVRDPTETLQHYRKAAFLLESVPESPETLELAVAARAGVLRSAAFLSVSRTELARVFEEGKALARRGRDQGGLVRLFGAYGAAQASSGNADLALENAKEAIRIATEMDSPEFEASLRAMIMFAYYGAGRLREALYYAEESQRRLTGGPSPADEEVTPENLISRGMRALMLVHMGGYEEAARDLERAIQLGLDQGKTFSWMHGALVDLAFFTRLSESAMHHARAAIASAEGFGSPFFMASAFRALGHAHVFEQQWPEAIAAYEHALGIIRETRTAVQLEAVMLALLAEAQLGAGDGLRARKSAEEAVEVARNHHTRVWECQARLMLTQALLSTEGAQASAKVEEELAQASALIEETGARGYLPVIHAVRAELAELNGDDASRQRELREAQRLFTEMGGTVPAQRIAEQLV